jgi:hypothetical protein
MRLRDGTTTPDPYPEANMRARSSIPALLSVVFAATACDSSPAGPLGPQGGAALLVVAPSAATINGGAKLQLNLSARDEDGQATRPTDVTWTTSNPKVALVGADGVVTGQATGASQITAWWNGVRGLSTVTVISDIPAAPPCPPIPGDPELLLKTICVPK